MFWIWGIAKAWLSKSSNKILNRKSLELILKYETGGRDYYNKFLSRPTYPGGASGLTIGVGFDCAYQTKEQIREAWQGILTDEQIKRLCVLIGITGTKAKALVALYRDIEIGYEQAVEVFERVTIPRFYELAKKTFPCFEELHPDAQGVLVSLVFNRGASLSGSSRTEMRAITELTCQKNYKAIAVQIRSMKRLWKGKGLDGLIARREDEARMMERIK